MMRHVVCVHLISYSLVISQIFDIDNHNVVTEANARKLFATNLFAARNIVKPADWEDYETAKANQAAAADSEYVKAVYAFAGTNDMELTFQEGTVMQLLQKVDADWWWCDLDDKQGYVPANYVEMTKAAPGAKASTKVNKFQTIKRGMEAEVLIFVLSKLSTTPGKIPRDVFVQWATDREMHLCFNVLEKFDLRANKRATTIIESSPAPPPASQSQILPSAGPVVPAHAIHPSGTQSAAASLQSLNVNPDAPEVLDGGLVVPDSAVRSSEAADSQSRISPELATVLRAAGIADKELEDLAMADFVTYFIDKHASKVVAQNSGGTVAGRRKKVKDDTVHRRPLPTPGSSVVPPPAPPAPSITVTSEAAPADSVSLNGPKVSLHDQIKAGKALKPSKKKTNLATLSKKDLTGLGLLLRVQIDSRRNIMMYSDGEESSSGEFGDD